MRKLVWGSSFMRASKKLIRKRPALQEDLQQVLSRLALDPWAVELRSHRLKGKLAGSWACSLNYELRIVFDLVKTETDEEAILLIDIGTHEEVY